MIDLFETIIKTHTAVMMGEYFKHNQISDTAKGMLAAGLRTPSLGTWQLFSRELYKELKQANHGFLCNDFSTAFEGLDKALNQEKTNVISFRNGYAHGATPTDEQCENDINQFEPFLNTLLSLQWLNETNIEAIDEKVHLRTGTDVLNLHPIIAYRAEETEQPLVFFNDLKNDKVGLLNYPLSKHYRDKSFFNEFNQYLPLQEWKKTGSNIFNQRIEELTETFKGRLTERATIKKFVATKQKGFLSIQGNPGIGKSALIAQVYKDLTNSEEKLPIQLVEYFIRRGTPQAEISYLINYLLKKTDELFPAGKEIRAEGQTTWELQQQLYNKWTSFGGTESPFKIIFLIDGLDEGVENDILKYLPHENFNNILFMYGSRPGGHQQLDKFWGELPVGHHQKIELGGLSKEDIRALLYEVTNKYEIDKDSAWIDYLQKRSQGNPLYLKLLCNAIEDGSIAINDVDALPKEIDDYYKAILQRYAQMPDGDHLLNCLFVFAAARDYLTPNHLSEVLGFGPATQTIVMSTLVEVLYENPMTENILDYQLFHESLREYLKKDRATEVAKAELRIIEFCGRWKNLEWNFEQLYILRHYAAHLSTQQNKAHHQTLIALTKDAEFIDTQKKVLRSFEATHQLYQYGIETATKNNWNEAAIDCGLGIVDLKYEEQNDVTAILEMVKHNEIELALQRITALGGPSAKDKKRQFIVIMLCIMELTLLESKTQNWRKNAIEKLLGLMEEQIPVDHSILDWGRFLPGYLMFMIAVELKAMDFGFIEIYKRSKKWQKDWIKNKGPYSDNQLDILIQTAESIIDDNEKKSALKEIAILLANQGEIEKSIQAAEGINDDREKLSTFNGIAVILANQGKLAKSSVKLVKSLQKDDGVNNDYYKLAITEIVLLLAKQNEIEKSIQIAEGINDDYHKSFALKEIAVVLANQGNLLESNNLMQNSIQKAEIIKTDWHKSEVFAEIAFALTNQGKFEESNKLIDKSILIAEGINDLILKSFVIEKIAVALANQGEIDKSIQIVEVINDDNEKSWALSAIAVLLAKKGEIERSIQTVECIKYDSAKSSALKQIAVLLANQGKIEKSIQTADGINEEYYKNNALEEIALLLANLGEMEKSLRTAEIINTDLRKTFVLTEIAVALANQGKLEVSSKVLEKSIRTAEGINGDYDKSAAFKKIAVVLANQGEIEKSIQTAELINYVLIKSATFAEIAIVLELQSKFDESKKVLEKLIQTADFEEISSVLACLGKLKECSTFLEKSIQPGEEKNYIEKSLVLKEIAVLLARQGELEKSIQTVDEINDDFKKNSALKTIAALLANQAEIKKSIQMAEAIKDDSEKKSALKEIAIVIANQGEIENSIMITEGIDNNYYKSLALKEIAVVLAKQGKLTDSSKLLEKSIHTAEAISHNSEKKSALKEIAIVLANQGKIAISTKITEGIDDNYYYSLALKEIAVVLANQGKLSESSILLEKSIQTIEGINDDDEKNWAYIEISVVLANQGEIEKSIQTVERINDEYEKSSAYTEISIVLFNQGKFQKSMNFLEKSIQIVDQKADGKGLRNYYSKIYSFKKIAVLLANKGELLKSVEVIQKINSGKVRMEACLEIGKEFYIKYQLQNLHQTLLQLPNDEAVTFFKKGIAQSITATNAKEETILQILPLVKADKESTEHLLQMHALYCAFFEKKPKEKIQKFNRSLNIQWALDIISTFPKEENVERVSTNLEEWIAEVEDEDDREDVLSWAEKVKAGSMTEEKFEERLKKIMGIK
jgi:hypothetical protein